MSVPKLGSLTITGYNSKLGNRCFEDKKEREDDNGNYVGYCKELNLNSDIMSKEKWAVHIINARTAKMVSKILELFRL